MWHYCFVCELYDGNFLAALADAVLPTTAVKENALTEAERKVRNIFTSTV